MNFLGFVRIPFLEGSANLASQSCDVRHPGHRIPVALAAERRWEIEGVELE